jgi:type I restriction enzyme R subunit
MKLLHHSYSTNGVRPSAHYREKVIDYLAEHSENPVIDKIRKLEPITRDDLVELENILWNELGTQQQYEDEHYRGTLAGFVRSLVDIDEEAVQEKFGEFLAGGTLNSDQQEFVHSIVDYLRENGEVTPDDLTNDEPFVNYDIAGLFEDRMEEFRKLVGRLNAICQEAA